MAYPYDPNDWRLFIDASKTSLKAVLVHNGNEKPSIPIRYAVNTKETYATMAHLLEIIKYREHNWKVCGDLKVVGLLLGLQSGFTKYSCFLCLWDSRAREHHYKRKEWPLREEFTPGQLNVCQRPLIEPRNIYTSAPVTYKTWTN